MIAVSSHPLAGITSPKDWNTCIYVFKLRNVSSRPSRTYIIYILYLSFKRRRGFSKKINSYCTTDVRFLSKRGNFGLSTLPDSTAKHHTPLPPHSFWTTIKYHHLGCADSCIGLGMMTVYIHVHTTVNRKASGDTCCTSDVKELHISDRKFYTRTPKS